MYQTWELLCVPWLLGTYVYRVTACLLHVPCHRRSECHPTSTTSSTYVTMRTSAKSSSLTRLRCSRLWDSTWVSHSPTDTSADTLGWVSLLRALYFYWRISSRFSYFVCETIFSILLVLLFAHTKYPLRCSVRLYLYIWYSLIWSMCVQILFFIVHTK